MKINIELIKKCLFIEGKLQNYQNDENIKQYMDITDWHKILLI